MEYEWSAFGPLAGECQRRYRESRREGIGHLNSQFMIVLQKHDRANISKRESGKISKINQLEKII
jgi:hypothetical protein